MKALYEHYDKLMREAKESTEKGYETIAKKKQSIRRLEKQIEKIEQSIYRYPSWVKEVLTPLADRISERLGLPYEIYGPFGLSCETSVYFQADKETAITDQPIKHLTVLPEYADDHSFYLLYYTGESTNEYMEGSIGYLNGFNNVRATLPDDFEAIMKIISKETNNN